MLQDVEGMPGWGRLSRVSVRPLGAPPHLMRGRAIRYTPPKSFGGVPLLSLARVQSNVSCFPPTLSESPPGTLIKTLSIRVFVRDSDKFRGEGRVIASEKHIGKNSNKNA